MPVINGRYYMNPQYGAALEADRAAAQAKDSSRKQKAPSNESWLDRQVDKIKGPLPPPPSPPKPPGLPPQVYDDMKIRDLRVRQVANIVANENHDVIPGNSTPEDLQQARIAQAHAIINADKRWGPNRGLPGYAPTASPEVTPSLSNSDQYRLALDAARTAFKADLAGHDPLSGRMYYNNRQTPSTDPRRLSRTSPEEVKVFQQFGPFQAGNRAVYTLTYDNPKNMAKPTPSKGH